LNDEFNLDDPLGLGAEKPAPAKGKPSAAARKSSGGKKFTPPPMDDAPEDEALDEEAPVDPPKAKFIDPEDDRENWPTIRIEPEEGKPNYEYLAANGTKKNGESFGHELQVMRDVDVKVPPSIVYALQDTIAAHYSQRIDPSTGKMQLVRQNRSAIPWRLVKGGKYC